MYYFFEKERQFLQCEVRNTDLPDTFAIVVTERLVGTKLSHTSRRIASGGVIAAVFLGLILEALSKAPLPLTAPSMDFNPTRMIGIALMTKYVLPFELLAVLLLVSLLAASYLARPEE